MSVFWLLWYCIYMLIMVILMKIFFSFFSLLRVPMDSPWCGDHGVQVWWLFFFGWKMASGSPLWVVRSQKWCRVGLSAVFRSCAQLCAAARSLCGSWIGVLAKISHLFCQNWWLGIILESNPSLGKKIAFVLPKWVAPSPHDQLLVLND